MGAGTVRAWQMGLTPAVARRGFADRDLPFLDLVRAGQVGLVRAVQRYDPAKGYRFATYATWWIRQAINRALADGAPRPPAEAVAPAGKAGGLGRAEYQLLRSLGREPSPEELAADLDPFLP